MTMEIVSNTSIAEMRQQASPGLLDFYMYSIARETLSQTSSQLTTQWMAAHRNQKGSLLKLM